MFLDRLIAAFVTHQVDYALVGGYAVALHGAIRGTLDIDAVIGLTESQYLQAEKALLELGLESRLPVRAARVFQFREEYIQERNLIAWNFFNPQNPMESVDVILTHDRHQMRTVSIQGAGMTYQVASIPDLIRMKTESGRPQDLADIEALNKILNVQLSQGKK